MWTDPTRRHFLESIGGSLWGMSLASLLAADGPRVAAAAAAADDPAAADLRPRLPQHFGRARSVIHLYMNGGPSQMDLFDPKPALDRLHGTRHYDKIAGEIENLSAAGAIMRSPFRFDRHGASGMWVSELMPHFARHVDDVAMIRSLQTTSITHEPAGYLMQSGKIGPGNPTLGAWVAYALGSENQNLPAYVVLDDPRGLPVNGIENWQAGFLPQQFQGTRFRSEGAPVLNLRPDADRPAAVEALARAVRARRDEAHRAARGPDPRLAARLASYELAARMQLAAAEALDLSRESAATAALYGLDREATASYGRRCLIARRLVERGVRFVQLYIQGQVWDHHSNIAEGLRQVCAQTDLPVAGLLSDLKQRGLLESTLVVWGGEFGRLPIAQLSGQDASRSGRDHNKNAFCCWLAGAGVRGGTVHGATDELGFAAVEGAVGVPDWHATLLHLLGLHHEEVAVLRHGLRERLTGVHPARVVREILA